MIRESALFYRAARMLSKVDCNGYRKTRKINPPARNMNIHRAKIPMRS
jgi:hypothetical protein